MTTLYRPVLIESAEQAEALPVGTVATHSSGAGMDHAHKVGLGDHLARGWLSLSADVSDAAMVGWTALVPIEAEEEHTTRWDEGDPVNDITRKRRFVTPWEEPMTTTDDFATAARAEAKRRWEFIQFDSYVQAAEENGKIHGFEKGAEWARDHLAAQEPTDAEVEAAAQAIDPDAWGRDSDGESQREHARDGARAALTAARRDEENR